MEGNQMKMREALRACFDFIMRLDRAFNPFMQNLLEKAMAKAQAALSAPPRQCDVGTAEEQHCRFIEYCNACDCPMGCIHRKQFIGMLDTRCASMLKCYIRWSQMPYEAEQKGEDDGR